MVSTSTLAGFSRVRVLGASLICRHQVRQVEFAGRRRKKSDAFYSRYGTMLVCVGIGRENGRVRIYCPRQHLGVVSSLPEALGAFSNLRRQVRPADACMLRR